MNTNTYYEDVRIDKNNGLGGFLTPPGHPEQTMSLQTDIKRKKENRGAMNLSYALTQDYISPAIKNKIKQILSDWDNSKLPLAEPPVQEWIKQVMTHFSKGYKGIEWIRQYYPEFTNSTI